MGKDYKAYIFNHLKKKTRMEAEILIHFLSNPRRIKSICTSPWPKISSFKFNGKEQLPHIDKPNAF